MFSVQCLLLGLQGYLIPFAPLAFIPHCQNCSRKMPSLLLVRPGLTHFTATPERTSYVSQSLAPQYFLPARHLRHARFHKRLRRQATDVLDPIKMAATWTAGITAAAGTRLTQSLFANFLDLAKASQSASTLAQYCHAFAHCEVFPTAAPRRAGNSVSDSLSGPLR